MKNTPLIIPEKQDDSLTLSLPKRLKLDKVAKTLISSGIGLAIAGAISSVLNSDDDDKPEKESHSEDEEDAQ